MYTCNVQLYVSNKKVGCSKSRKTYSIASITRRLSWGCLYKWKNQVLRFSMRMLAVQSICARNPRKKGLRTSSIWYSLTIHAIISGSIMILQIWTNFGLNIDWSLSNGRGSACDLHAICCIVVDLIFRYHPRVLTIFPLLRSRSHPINCDINLHLLRPRLNSRMYTS